jgi:imidazolonepropionase
VAAVRSTLVTGIGELTTNDPELGTRTGAALVLQGDRVAWVGDAAAAPAADARFDAGGRAVLPGWVDSHTHLLFAGDRAAEFAARMAGEPYAAGGIAVTVEATRAATDEQLTTTLARHVAEAQRQGTTTLETKTGYGLTVADERRAAALAAADPGVDEVTFLGAHLVPPGADPDDYLALVTGPMLDAVAPHVGWVDVFCERGAFDAEASAAVLRAGAAHGLGLRVHGNQLGEGPGVQLAVRHGAASVDHCTYLSAADVDALAAANTVATLLPACDLSTRQPLPPARALLDAGATVALASNCNPGSSYTTSMAFCVATAVLQMRMTVTEAVWAATAGGAVALGRHTGPGAVGVLRPGARADLHVLDAPAAAHLAYRPGVPLTHAVFRAGVRVAG